ncbi:hypothetical protein KUU44_38865, partial [Pseudomonas aeruginosa]|nr:hypothetical protein [Pseudomonas aeruginosa]
LWINLRRYRCPCAQITWSSLWVSRGKIHAGLYSSVLQVSVRFLIDGFSGSSTVAHKSLGQICG